VRIVNEMAAQVNPASQPAVASPIETSQKPTIHRSRKLPRIAASLPIHQCECDSVQGLCRPTVSWCTAPLNVTGTAGGAVTEPPGNMVALPSNTDVCRWFLLVAERPLSPARTRSDISALATAGGADEARLDVTQSDIIRPLVGDHLDPMRASIIRAVDQHGANA
jgi:hypothetical protein